MTQNVLLNCFDPSFNSATFAVTSKISRFFNGRILSQTTRPEWRPAMDRTRVKSIVIIPSSEVVKLSREELREKLTTSLLNCRDDLRRQLSQASDHVYNEYSSHFGEEPEFMTFMPNGVKVFPWQGVLDPEYGFLMEISFSLMASSQIPYGGVVVDEMPFRKAFEFDVEKLLTTLENSDNVRVEPSEKLLPLLSVGLIKLL